MLSYEYVWQLRPMVVVDVVVVLRSGLVLVEYEQSRESVNQVASKKG